MNKELNKFMTYEFPRIMFYGIFDILLIVSWGIIGLLAKEQVLLTNKKTLLWFLPLFIFTFSSYNYFMIRRWFEKWGVFK